MSERRIQRNRGAGALARPQLAANRSSSALAAYRLALWLVRNEHDAEDVVQEAALRAFRYFRGFSGGNGRAWFLKIVRNACYSWRAQSVRTPTDVFDEEQHGSAQSMLDPETLLLHAADASLIENTLGSLPARFRELLVLREIEGLSYQELAEVLDIPIGTVMSGLSRARQAFRGALETHRKRFDRAAEKSFS